MANTIQNGAADLQKWQALQTQANTTQDVTKEQLLELKDQLKKDGFDVSSTSKLGQGFDNLQNVIDTTTFKTRSDTETNNMWTQASNEVSALLNDPTTNTADADNAGYKATSTALDADISKNKTLTAQLAADTANGNKDGIASGITAISTNVQSQIQHINDGVANGSIDMTLGSRMVGYLNNADFALKQKAPDGTPAPNMDMWNSMTNFYATSLTQLRAGDAGGAQTAAGTSGATAGAGTIGTGGASQAAATDPATAANATPGTVKMTAGATGTPPTIPAASDLAKAAGTTPAPSITFSPVDHMFASVGSDGKVGVYGPDGKAITASLGDGQAIKVTNPNKDGGQAGFVTVDKSGNFAGVEPKDDTKIAAVITGKDGNYVSNLSAQGDGAAPMQIPNNSDLTKAMDRRKDAKIVFSPVDHMYALQLGDNKYDLYGPDGASLGTKLKPGDVIKVTNPATGQAGEVTINTNGQFEARSAGNNGDPKVSITGSNGVYVQEVKPEDAGSDPLPADM